MPPVFSWTYRVCDCVLLLNITGPMLERWGVFLASRHFHEMMNQWRLTSVLPGWFTQITKNTLSHFPRVVSSGAGNVCSQFWCNENVVWTSLEESEAWWLSWLTLAKTLVLERQAASNFQSFVLPLSFYSWVMRICVTRLHPKLLFNNRLLSDNMYWSFCLSC